MSDIYSHQIQNGMSDCSNDTFEFSFRIFGDLLRNVFGIRQKKSKFIIIYVKCNLRRKEISVEKIYIFFLYFKKEQKFTSEFSRKGSMLNESNSRKLSIFGEKILK